jgi:hypothetical protein
MDVCRDARRRHIFWSSRRRKSPGHYRWFPFESSFMPMGDGVQMLPIKADIRKTIGKEVGATVEVIILERL